MYRKTRGEGFSHAFRGERINVSGRVSTQQLALAGPALYPSRFTLEEFATLRRPGLLSFQLSRLVNAVIPGHCVEVDSLRGESSLESHAHLYSIQFLSSLGVIFITAASLCRRRKYHPELFALETFLISFPSMEVC